MLGGGQLGQMFCHAAKRAGVKTHVFCPVDGEPATQVCDSKTIAAYDDLEAVERFAKSVDAVTYEFENVPAETAAVCARYCPVRPGQQVLHVAQDRIREKTFLSEHGIPVGPFAKVTSLEELREAVKTIGVPGVLKTASGGYDGKGQRVLHASGGSDEAELIYVWEDLGRRPCIYEGFIDFEQEVSVVAARGTAESGGQVVCYGPIANSHRNHILDVSVVPSGAPASVEQEAVEIARRVMQSLDAVGVLCVEFFQTRDGRMLVNELAPRPHNSGHLTIDAYTHSQFDQQVACVMGRAPLAIDRKSPAAMVNLLGELWPAEEGRGSGEPNWGAIAGSERLHLHLYGKARARPGRKMGHLTALARTPHEAIRDAVEARARLTPTPPIDQT